MRYNDLFVTGWKIAKNPIFKRKISRVLIFAVWTNLNISRVQIFAILCENRENREN